MTSEIRRRATTFFALLVWLYGLAVMVIWLMLLARADVWWPATILAFAPRWVWALPLPLLAAAGWFLRPKLLWPLSAMGLVLLGPVMGFQFHSPSIGNTGDDCFRIRVLTCNSGQDSVDPHVLRSLIEETRPDVVMLQEWSPTMGSTMFDPDRWHLVEGKGLCAASVYPLEEMAKQRDENDWTDMAIRYQISAPGGTFQVLNLHLPTTRDALDAVLVQRWNAGPAVRANTELRERGSAAVRQLLDGVEGPILIAGDFNMPIESAIYRRHWSRFANAFSFAGNGFGHTKFGRRFRIRIDHVLSNEHWRCRRCWVGPDVGSDHRPVLADFELTTTLRE